MERAVDVSRSMFIVFADAAVRDGAVVEMSVNGKQVDVLSTTAWPVGWESVVLEFRKSPIMVRPDEVPVQESLALHWTSRLLAAVLALLPYEPADGYFEREGSPREVTCTKYERSPVNRAACIEIHGVRCKCCGISFADAYGPLGEGFIEVHHVRPVSTIGSNSAINPFIDLIPVCPNCHSMLHRRNPPLLPDDLIRVIRKQDASQ